VYTVLHTPIVTEPLMNLLTAFAIPGTQASSQVLPAPLRRARFVHKGNLKAPVAYPLVFHVLTIATL
jgi:hypothetical protein